MEYQIRIGDPAGNKTVFIMNEVPEEKRAEVANALLARKELGGEQAAFIVPPKAGGDGRIEMMGGEFCGNALRCYGYLLAEDAAQNGCQSGIQNVRVEISGTDQVFTVTADLKEHTAQTQMPIPLGYDYIDFGQRYDLGAIPVIRMEGIWHLILEHRTPEQEVIDYVLAVMKKKYMPDALGILFMTGSQGNGRQLFPYVYVKKTDSFVQESSCGSGSLACCWWLTKRNGSFTGNYNFLQPGGIIRTRVEYTKEGECTGGTIGGEVAVGEAFTVSL